MGGISTDIAELGMMDELARGSSPAHRLDARAKVLVTAAFCLCVVSFGKYEVSSLAAFAFYPAAMAAMAGLPWRYLVRKLLLVSPFAVMVGVFNPLIDRVPAADIGGLIVSGGWLSFASIFMRFVLTVLAVLILLASTGIDGVTSALERMGFPRVFTVQVMFLYRYLFLLSDEAAGIVRAHTLRGGHGFPRLPVFVRMAGCLLVRSIDRAHRVYAAMESRGFDGHIRWSGRSKWRMADSAYVLFWTVTFLFLRFGDVVNTAGGFTVRCFR